ncbi:MAG: protein kinase, partial [Planctomycetales bacterium]|nr:protein kinase [Planctomycetales bacterium]
MSTGSRLTRTGQALGTPATMSPEQARGEVSSLTPATDVWSLGCVLYEMLAGRPPFEGETSAAVVAAVLTREPTALRRLRPDAPRDLGRILRVAFARAPDARYPEAGAMGDDLDRVLRGAPALARPPASRALRLAGAAAGVALLAAGAWALRLAGPGPGSPAGSPDSPRPGEAAGVRAASRGRELLPSDPHEASRLLGDALRERPDHPDAPAWRLERGLALWYVADFPGAIGEWSAVPEGTPEAARARLHRGLAHYFLGDFARAEPDLGDLARGAGSDAALARGALEASEGRWDAAREALRDLPGWQAALLRAHIENAATDGEPERAAREATAALSGGIRSVWPLFERSRARLHLGDA